MAEIFTTNFAFFLAVGLAMDTTGAVHDLVYGQMHADLASWGITISPQEPGGQSLALTPEVTSFVYEVDPDTLSILESAALPYRGMYVWVAGPPRFSTLCTELMPSEGTTHSPGTLTLTIHSPANPQHHPLILNVMVMTLAGGGIKLWDWALRAHRVQSCIPRLPTMSMWCNPDIPAALVPHLLSRPYQRVRFNSI